MAIKRRNTEKTNNSAGLAEAIKRNAEILSQLEEEPCFAVPTVVIDLGTHDQGYGIWAKDEAASYVETKEEAEELINQAAKIDPKTTYNFIESEEGESLQVLPFKVVTSKKTGKSFVFVAEDWEPDNCTFLDDPDEVEELVEKATEIDSASKYPKLPENIEIKTWDSYFMVPFKLIKQKPQQELLVKIEIDQQVVLSEGEDPVNYTIETGKFFSGEYTGIRIPNEGSKFSDKNLLRALAVAAKCKDIVDEEKEDFLSVSKLNTPMMVSFTLEPYTSNEVEGIKMKEISYTAVHKSMAGPAEEFMKTCQDYVEIPYSEKITVELLKKAKVSQNVVNKMKKAVEYDDPEYGGDVVADVLTEYEEYLKSEHKGDTGEEKAEPKKTTKSSTKKEPVKSKPTSKPSMKVEEDPEEEEVDLDDLDEE